MITIHEAIEIRDEINAALAAGDTTTARQRFGALCFVLDELAKPNLRGAGRKPGGDSITRARMRFNDLISDGKSKTQIMDIMGISASTYYRYLADFKEYQ